MCDCDCEGPEVSSVKLVRARKPHRCGECRSEIPVGSEYENTFGIWDGDASTFKTCLGCIELRKWAAEHTECFCWRYTELHHDILDEMHECDPFHVGLYPQAKFRIETLRAQRKASAVSEPVTPKSSSAAALSEGGE